MKNQTDVALQQRKKVKDKNVMRKNLQPISSCAISSRSGKISYSDGCIISTKYAQQFNTFFF
jgi:hypothetical protein